MSRRPSSRCREGSQSDYLCVPVSELMRLAKVPRGRNLRGDWLLGTLVVKAADGYRPLRAASIESFVTALRDEIRNQSGSGQI